MINFGNIEYKSLEQIQQENLLPKGNYAFEVIASEETQAKTGSPMIMLSLTLDLGHKFVSKRDWLVFSENSLWKVKHACESMNLLKEFEMRNLSADNFLNKYGMLVIDHKKNKERGLMEAYVKDYIPRPEMLKDVPAEYQQYAQLSNKNNKSYSDLI